MKKKIKAIILMLVCVFALAACGDGSFTPLVEGDPHASLDAEMQFICTYVVGFGSSKEQLDYFDKLKSHELEDNTELLKQYAGQLQMNTRMDFEVLLKGAHSYYDAREEIGENELEDAVLQGASFPSDIEYDVKADEVVAQAHFKTRDPNGHDGIIEVMFDKNLHVTAITVNTVLSMGESMERAGVNTLIGMGSVFIMLIVIALIISLLKYVPMILDGLKGKPVEKTEESLDKTIAGIVEREEAQEIVEDDTELVAVIAAAIAASEGAASTEGFVVRSIRRVR
ncbi:MAG: OadG family protein [Lachnospiraceae bacterium]|nr:OadG family protein [Lachnospiraceae bacterium]